MDPIPENLHIDSGEPHIADTWFWKANRTDPAGYADDKLQQVSLNKLNKANRVMSQGGKVTYLKRKDDFGKPAYRDQLFVDFKGQQLERFIPQSPSGSRADVRAKGRWHKGYWTIEFSRLLENGNNDDIQFNTSKVYIFGVSRFEIAGSQPNPNIDQPLYGAGRLSERLFLKNSSSKN